MDEHKPETQIAVEKKDDKLEKIKPKKIKAVPIGSAERYFPKVREGLSSAQVECRKLDGLTNYVAKNKGKTYFQIFLTNIFTFFNLIYIIVCLTLAYFRIWSDMFFMLTIVANTGIAIIQEIKSKRTIDKLSLLSAPQAKVIRNSIAEDISVGEVVLDDVLYLTNGKQISADSVLLEGNIEVNEALLTGESITISKHKDDKLFAGSYVTSGSCYAKADKVGIYNYIESLTAKAKVYKKPRSELLKSLKIILNIIAVIIIPIAYFSFMNNLNNAPINVEPIIYAVRKTAGTVIGMIPAGPFLLTSITLALGVIRLAQRNTMVQELYCIEMLARVNVLCLDKTGTITDGTMRVVECVDLKGDSKYLLKDIVGSMTKALNDNNLTSIALRDYFGVSNMLKPTAVVPFSSARKLSAVSFEGEGTFFLGAPEFILTTANTRIDAMVKKYAEQGYRVLLLAQSSSVIYGDEKTDYSKLPLVRRPLTLIVIEDHIREDAPATIEWFNDNDVDVKIISGDNPLTVSEIARKVGVKDADKFISLEGLSDKEVIEIAGNYTVFGRVSPDQKAVLIKALKSYGKTVAMTGDGVNDILALREADCSIAMASGSEAARNVSHLILLDNNFANLPRVVGEGRRVVNNIQNATSLFFMKTIYTIVISILALIVNKPYPFTTTQVILLEVVVVGIPTTLLAMQRNNNLIKGKFLLNIFKRAVPASLTFLFSTVFLYIVAEFFIPIERVQLETMAVLCLTYSSLFALYHACKPFNVFRSILFVFSTTAVVLGSIFLSSVFGFATLDVNSLLLTIVMIELSFPLMALLRHLLDRTKI